MTLTYAVCTVCHGAMIHTGFDHHPACGPDGDAYRAEFGKRAALATVAQGSPALIAEGVRIIGAAAAQHHYVSANLTRDAMNEAGITGPRVGACYNRAAKLGLIRRDGFIPSTQRETHSHQIARWVSLVYRGAA